MAVEANTNAIENERIYREYMKKKDTNRNSLLNPQVTWQDLAIRHSKTLAMQRICPNTAAKVLDVGCGSGSGLLFFLETGFSSENLTGIDIWQERILKGKRRFPSLNLLCGDASGLEFPDSSFDIVSESTMFIIMTDNALANKIATEMIRVLKPGGYLLITDWRYDKPWSSEFCAVDKKRLTKLFDIGVKTRLIERYSGALVPPLGRMLSKYVPALYMPVRYLFPFTVGLKTNLLQKL